MSPDDQMDEIRVLQLTLHSKLVGYLAGYQNGRITVLGHLYNRLFNRLYSLALSNQFLVLNLP